MLTQVLALVSGITIHVSAGSTTPAGSATQFLPQPTSLTSTGLAVFLADRVVDGIDELWVARLDGSPPWRLSGNLPAGGSVSRFWVAPDGKHVAFYGDPVVDGDFGLYVAPIDGSALVRVSQPGDVVQLAVGDKPWAPDGQRLIYDTRVGSSDVLWAVGPDGTGRAQISQGLHASVGVADFVWAPDSSRVAYRSDPVLKNRFELYSATPDGVSIDRAHPPLVTDNADIDRFLWSPDSSSLLMLGDVFTLSEEELYVAAVDGTSFADVSSANAIAGHFIQQFDWTPDSQRVVFVSNAVQQNELELWSVGADGTGWTKLSGILPVNGDVVSFYIAPDGSRVAYRADQTVNDRVELYTTRLDGTGNVPVSGPFVSGGQVDLTGVVFWSPDSAHLAYLADQETNNRPEVYVANPDGSGNVKVSGQLYPTSNMGFPNANPWSPTSSRLTYTANSFGLHPITVRPDGSGVAAVNGRLAPGGASSDARWSHDGSRLLYRASQLTFGVFELFASGPAGGNNQRVSGSMVTNGDVNVMHWAVH